MSKDSFMKDKHINFKITGQGVITAIIAVISIGVVAWPVMMWGTYTNTDAPYHLARIEGIYLDLLEGIFPAKVHMAGAYSYGYGTGFFYPDFFLYIPACLMLMGMTLEQSYKIFKFLIIIVTYVLMFQSIRHIRRETPVYLCAFGAAAYICNTQFITYLYGSQALGSYMAMAFLPPAIVSLLCILWREHGTSDLVMLTLSMCAVLESHLSTALIAIVFLVILCVMGIRRLVTNPRILGELLLCAICGASLTISYWLPMLEQLSVQQYKFQTSLIYPVSKNTVPWSRMLKTIGYDMVVMIVVIFLLLILGRLHCKSRQNKNVAANMELYDVSLHGADSLQGTEQQGPMVTGIVTAAFVSFVFIILVYCRTFWEQFGVFLDWLQFPTRILGPAMATVIIIYALIVAEFVSATNTRLGRGLFILAIVVFLAGIIPTGYRIFNMSHPEHLEAGLILDTIGGLGSGEEWMPEGADRVGLEEPNKSYDPDGVGADGFKHDHAKYYEVYVLLDKEYYDVPYLYYKGYEAYLLDNNGVPTEQLQIGKSDRLAYVRVYMPEGGDGIGHIMVTYRKTAIQKVSYIVNVVVVVGLAAMYIVSVRRHRQGKGYNA